MSMIRSLRGQRAQLNTNVGLAVTNENTQAILEIAYRELPLSGVPVPGKCFGSSCNYPESVKRMTAARVSNN